jgi:hypothetical protein
VMCRVARVVGTLHGRKAVEFDAEAPQDRP